MDPTLTPRRFVALAVAVGALQACGAPDPATRTEEGVYGASSGPNPNLQDLQEGAPATPPDARGETPSSAEANTYPSQASQPPPATGAAGGRSSAQTGASLETTP